MSYSFDPSAPSFHRIKSVTINGKPIDKLKIYTLATSNFLANGGDGYYALKNAQSKNVLSIRPPQISDLVMQTIVNQYTVMPAVDGRILNIVEGGR